MEESDDRSLRVLERVHCFTRPFMYNPIPAPGQVGVTNSQAAFRRPSVARLGVTVAMHSLSDNTSLQRLSSRPAPLWKARAGSETKCI